MRNIILFIIVVSCSEYYGQLLSLDDLLMYVKKKPTVLTETLLNKGWQLNSSNRQMSEDGSMLFTEAVEWAFKPAGHEVVTTWLNYKKEFEVDPEKQVGYYINLIFTFSNLEHFSKSKTQAKLKGWKLQQDEVIEDGMVQTFDQGTYSIVFMIKKIEQKQFFTIVVHTKKPVE